MGRHYSYPLNAETPEGGLDVAALAALSTSQLNRLVDLCAAVLRDTARSTDDLSERLFLLREAVQSLSDEPEAWEARPEPAVQCRRHPKCHPNPLFGGSCACGAVRERRN